MTDDHGLAMKCQAMDCMLEGGMALPPHEEAVETWRGSLATKGELNTLPSHVPLALVASEDQRFPQHFGVDMTEIKKALEQFEAAYSYKELSGFLFNMGQCHMELKQFDMALKRYNQYLRESPKARNRDKVEDLIRTATAAKVRSF